MSRVVILGQSDSLRQHVYDALGAAHDVTAAEPKDVETRWRMRALLSGVDAVVLLPCPDRAQQLGPDLEFAKHALASCSETAISNVVVVSSAEAYGATPRNPGFIAESRPISRNAKNAISMVWLALEELAANALLGSLHTKLTILRPCAVPVRGGLDYYSQLLSGRAALMLAGHDPSLQFLTPADFAHAIVCAVDGHVGGIFNVAPDGVIPISAALGLVHVKHVALPRALQIHARRFLSGLGIAAPIDQLEYVRYSWTVSNRRIKDKLGFAPKSTSAQAVEAFARAGSDNVDAADSAPREFDDFGMDPDYIAARGRTLFEFLARYYWRIEVEGLEHVPRQGRAVLVGVHRGLVAWDGAMMLHLLVQRLQRIPRFLVHPTGFQFPFAFNFTTKFGGIVACQENADYVLTHDELLGIFPEGLRGIFTLYREAYVLRKFGRHDFVKIALRHRAPIVPFVIVGSAETYPIVGRINWDFWTRKTKWPYFPVTPTLFPLNPVPLPSKWYIRFLPPIDVSGYPPSALKDAALVRSLSDRVRADMQRAIAELHDRRKSIFFG